MRQPSGNIIPISSIFPLLEFSKIKTNFLKQNLQENIQNALGGLIPWSSQHSLVIKDTEKVIFCFNASVGWKQSNVRVLLLCMPIFCAETEVKQQYCVFYIYSNVLVQG